MRQPSRNGKKWLVLLALPAIIGGVLVWQRNSILEWYYVRGLANADESDRAQWAQRVSGLDVAALPRLLSILRRADGRACANVEAGLVGMLHRWGEDDPRAQSLAEEVLRRFPDLSPEGQQAALQVPIAWLGMSPQPVAPAARTVTAGSFLTASAQVAEVRGRAILLAQALLQRSSPGQWTDLCTDLALNGLSDSAAETRSAAINLAWFLSRSEPKLLIRVAALLHDPAAEVRQAALIAVGPSRDVIIDDELLPLLHDADREVRRLCEEALRSRGLLDSHLLLARLISDPRPGARLQVVSQLGHAEDLEPGVWLRRLSHDPAPAVRAAAVRAAYFQTQVDLRERLRQMARDDPSPTVRQLADHYLNRPPLEMD